MITRLAAVAALSLLSACTASTQPAAPVKDADIADLNQYWQQDRDSVPQDVPAENGCVRVRAVIDFEGKLEQAEVLAVVGSAVSAWMPEFLSGLRFKPAPENTAKTPIRSVFTWTFIQNVETKAVPSGSIAEAMHAAMDSKPSDAVLEAGQQCKAELDKQMGIGTP